ncbi:MAG: radical SAM protein [Bacteroidetes bacterium]|nr:radical SAM protein [Bacteroidota bacterium]
MSSNIAQNISNAIPPVIKNAVPGFVKKFYREVFYGPPASPSYKINGTHSFRKERLLMEKLHKTGERFIPTVLDFPPTIRIETTTRCNLTCTHCPNSVLSDVEGFLEDIDTGVYKKIIDEVAKEAPHIRVRPFGGGEPLFRKDMEDLIRYAHEKGLTNLSLNTNGTLLVKSRRKKLIEGGLNHIEVSIDAATPETYLKIRQSKLFNRLVENTLSYIEEAKAHDSDNKIDVSFVYQKDNQHELEMFQEFWTGKADVVLIRDYHQHNNLVDDHGRHNQQSFKYRHPCPYLWDRFIIHTNGLVKFCEYDWKGEHILGDIRKNTIKEIWQGENFRKLRQMHVDGTFDYPYCKNCVDWAEPKWW